MTEFTVSKSKVGPITARYRDGEFKDVEETNEKGIKRRAILGLDNSHNKDYKVAYASDPVITIRGGRGVSHSNIEGVLREFGVWDAAKFHPIEIPGGEGWICGFKTTPERTHIITRLYNAFESELDDHQLLGDEDKFTVYL